LAGWIGRATAAFRRSAAPAPQPFQLPCDCGEAITGWRTESHQRVPCPACRQVHLVLPGNIYPFVKQTAAAPPKKKTPAAAQPDRTSPIVEPEDRKKARRRGKPSKAVESEKEVSPATTPTATAEPDVAKIDLSPTLQQGRRRRWRLRLIVVSIMALVAVTGWSLWNRAQREHARATIPIASKAGIDALRAGDFITAKRELTAAVEGLDTLRWFDAGAMAIRQGHREAVAGEGLLPKDFVSVAEEVLAGAGTEEERQRRFRTEAGSKWLLFDADLTQSSTSGYELDVPLAVQDRALQVACEFPELRRLTAETPPGQATRVIFAAQVDQWQFPTAIGQPLIARLRNSTAFVWTDYDAYAAAGYHADSPEAEAETRAILSTQRELVAP
jgi:hypothetical protein